GGRDGVRDPAAHPRRRGLSHADVRALRRDRSLEQTRAAIAAQRLLGRPGAAAPAVGSLSHGSDPRMSLRRFVRRWASRRLDPDLDPRIRDYLALRFRPDRALPLAQASFVVLDTETSGLDVRRDRLLSLSAVSVRAGRIVLSDRVELTFAAASVGASEAAVVHQLVTADLHGGVDEREGVAAF